VLSLSPPSPSSVKVKGREKGREGKEEWEEVGGGQW